MDMDIYVVMRQADVGECIAFGAYSSYEKADAACDAQQDEDGDAYVLWIEKVVLDADGS